MQINRSSDFKKDRETQSARCILSDADLLSSATPRIMVVTRKGHMSESVMAYAVNVADRLGYSILAVYVNTLPFFRDGGARGNRFTKAVEESALQFAAKAEAKQVGFSCISESGKVGAVVQRLCQAARRIEFIVVDQNLRTTDVASKSPVPVFSVVSTSKSGGSKGAGIKTKHFWKGEATMSTTSKSRYVKRAVMFGAGVIALYATVFTHSDLLMSYCTRGGIYAILPVATVFLFSYVHGSFTSAFWSALGIEGSKATAAKTAKERAEKASQKTTRKDTRPRAHAGA